VRILLERGARAFELGLDRVEFLPHPQLAQALELLRRVAGQGCRLCVLQLVHDAQHELACARHARAHRGRDPALRLRDRFVRSVRDALPVPAQVSELRLVALFACDRERALESAVAQVERVAIGGVGVRFVDLTRVDAHVGAQPAAARSARRLGRQRLANVGQQEGFERIVRQGGVELLRPVGRGGLAGEKDLSEAGGAALGVLQQGAGDGSCGTGQAVEPFAFGVLELGLGLEFSHASPL